MEPAKNPLACAVVVSVLLAIGTAPEGPHGTCTAFAQAPTANGPTADFFVSPKGNDRRSGRLADPGASDGPFATLERALDAIRALRRKHGPRIAVRATIRGGTYYLASGSLKGHSAAADASRPLTHTAKEEFEDENSKHFASRGLVVYAGGDIGGQHGERQADGIAFRRAREVGRRREHHGSDFRERRLFRRFVRFNMLENFPDDGLDWTVDAFVVSDLWVANLVPASPPGATPAKGPLRVHPENPRYLTATDAKPGVRGLGRRFP